MDFSGLGKGIGFKVSSGHVLLHRCVSYYGQTYIAQSCSFNFIVLEVLHVLWDYKMGIGKLYVMVSHCRMPTIVDCKL